MEDTSTPSKALRNVLLFLLGFLALGALGGGIVLIISPYGEMMGLPISNFKNMPFESFLIPGIILALALGVAPFLLMFALVKKPDSKLAETFNVYKDMHWSWTYTVYVGITLVSWIQIQLIFLSTAPFWLHFFYVFFGLLIIAVALMPQVRKLYS